MPQPICTFDPSKVIIAVEGAQGVAGRYAAFDFVDGAVVVVDGRALMVRVEDLGSVPREIVEQLERIAGPISQDDLGPAF